MQGMGAWDIFSRTLIPTRTYTIPMTAIVLNPTEAFNLWKCRWKDFWNTFEVALLKDPYYNSEDQQIVLKGHR